MAAPGNFGTYGFGFAAGTGANREDLLDLITNVDPWDTPWVTQAPKTRAMHVVHEWLADTLAATSTATGTGGSIAVEGDDWAYYTNTTRPVRVTNNTMIFRKDISVSETQRAVNPAGFKDAYAYEIAKATKELARNLEVWIFHGSSTASVTGSSAAARYMIGLAGFVNATATSTNYPYVINATALNAATASAISSTQFNDALQNAYTNGGNPEQVYVSPAIKRQLSAFTVSQQNRNIAAIDQKLVNSIDFYVSDFGVVQIVLDRWVPQATNTGTTTAASDVSGVLFFLERSKNRLAWLRPMQHTLVGKRGDSVAGTILGEVTLECLNGKSNYKIKGANNVTA